jgi:hypothetical protein
MDVSDIVDYNVGLLNRNDLINSFFCLSKNDPAVGFTYDASSIAGCTYPDAINGPRTSGKLCRMRPGTYDEIDQRLSYRTVMSLESSDRDIGLLCPLSVSKFGC